MAKAVRLEDIAKVIGVSNVTVSKALTDKEGVSDELRVKIKDLAKQMGYKVKKLEQSSQNRGDIGIVIPSRFIDKNCSFYWEVYEKLISWLSNMGYYGILEVIDASDEETCELPRVIKDGKVQGVVIVGQVSREYMLFMQEYSMPTVFLDAYDSKVVSDAIVSDGYYGMYNLTNYLLERGHRDICFVGTLMATSSICDRFFGYARAMYEQGIVVTEKNIINDRTTQNSQINIELPEHIPTAYACNCDSTAYNLINVLKEKGYRIPEDVSVVGFDNYLVSEIASPKITTYEVDINAMARACAERIVKKILKPDYKAGVKVIVGKIIERESVKTLC